MLRCGGHFATDHVGYGHSMSLRAALFPPSLRHCGTWARTRSWLVADILSITPWSILVNVLVKHRPHLSDRVYQNKYRKGRCTQIHGS